MFDFNDPSIKVQMCKFEAYIEKVHIVIKFPCSYFVEWKTINNRYNICTQKRVRTANDETIFNEKLTFYTEMVFNTKKKEYYSKETFLVLNLVSKSRPDQVKLVGRISVDLAEVLNKRKFEQVTKMKLNYCSVEGSIVFGITLLNKRDSNLSVKDLDRSAFTDYFSLNPINRMMIEESINGNFVSQNKGVQNGVKYDRQINNGYSGVQLREKQREKSKEQSKEQFRQHFRSQTHQQPDFGPSFAGIISQEPQQNQISSLYQNKQKPYQKDEQVISFQNSQLRQEPVERYINESPRTSYSKEQSLIEKLQEKNFRQYEKGNVVEVKGREARTDRMIASQGNANNLYEMGNSGHKSKGMNKIDEEIESGQIRRQQSVINKTSNTSRLPSSITNQPLAKPTSPPSYQRQLIHTNSSSKLSQTSQCQNQQLLSIVEKLQHQKIEQESMIQSLKTMLANKAMRKKEGSKVSQHEEQNQNSRLKQIAEENDHLRKDNHKLLNGLQTKESQLKQKSMHVFELLDKIKKLENYVVTSDITINKLQNELAISDNKIKLYEDEIAQLHLSQIQNQKICESLKLSLSLQRAAQNQPSMLLPKKSCKLLQKTPMYVLNELQDKHRLSESQHPQPQQQQFKILITKDENIYEEMEKQNLQLTQRVKQLEEQIQIYKELLKQQNYSSSELKESIPLSVLPHQQIVTSHLETEDIPFTITVSKNTNIYQNYQNLEQENTELYDRIKQLQNLIQIYQELIKQENYPEKKNQQQIRNIVIQTLQPENMGEYQTSINSIPDVNQSSQLMSSLLTKNQPFETSQIPETSHQEMNLVGETFKIILTKDKNIYKEQEQENIELSKRVIELQEQMEKYKELLKNQNEHNRRDNFKNVKQATTEKEEHYQEEGFTITLTQDKNIFENQQKELSEYQAQVRELQSIVEKYKSLYGPIENQPQYKVSITRQDRIYQDQEIQIQQLLKSLQLKDDQVMELTTRLSVLERQLQQLRPNNNSGEIKINIMRDQNIYDQQEKDIKELSQRVLELQQNLKVLVNDLEQKEVLLKQTQNQLASNEKHQNPSTNLSSPTTPLKCVTCANFQKKVLQLQTNIQLIEEQKSLLEEQIGALEEEKFCLTSTQNELKITIEDLRGEIDLLGQQNERLLQEINFLQQHIDEAQENNNLGGNQQTQVNQEKFVMTLPQNVFSSYKHSNSSTIPLKQLPQSPKSPKPLKSPKTSQLLISLQQQNNHLRQSLSNFEEQLEEQYLTISELEQRISRLMHEKQILIERNQELSHEIILRGEKEQNINQRETAFRERIIELEKELTSLKAQSLTTISTSNITRPDSISENHNKQKMTELQNELSTLRNELSLTKLAQQSSSPLFEQLKQKQQQIQQLQTQLEALNQSLNELSISYQSLQKNLLQLEEQKEAQVESIRQEYETVNTTLKSDLESIEHIILEKQKICQESSIQLKQRGKEIEQLIDQIEQIKNNHSSEVNTLKTQADTLLKENNQLKIKLSTIDQLKPRISSSKQEINYKQKIFIILKEIKLSKQQQITQFSQLICLIQQRLNQEGFSSPICLQENLAKSISKEIQKIKINIMRNNQTSNSTLGGVIQRTNLSKTVSNHEFKTFAEKSMMLNYLKPIEDLVKGY